MRKEVASSWASQQLGRPLVKDMPKAFQEATWMEAR